MAVTNPEMIRGRMPVLVSLLILLLAGMWSLRRCSGRGMARHPAGDTLVVAIEVSPLSYSLAGDTVSGFDYEMLSDIARLHGVPVVFHPFVPLKHAFEGLHRGDFDIVAASMPSTSELKKYFRMTDAVYIDRQVLVQRAGPDITDRLGLVGDTVWLAEGSPNAARLRNMARELGDSIYVRQETGYSSELLVMLVAIGEIPRAVVPERVAWRLAPQYPGIDISTPVSFNQFQAWAVGSADEELQDSLNRWIGQYKATPAYQRLVEKYL